MINRKRENKRRKKGGSNLILLLLAAVILFFVLNYMTESEKTAFIAPVNLNKNFQLPGGTLGTLNDGSKLDFSPVVATLEIDLIGEAFFKMNESQSIAVNTIQGRLVAIRSNFNVRSWGENLYVENYQGKVAVIVGDQSFGLNKGESVNFVNGKAEKVIPIRGDEPLWLKGIMRFYDVPIQEVFDELERQFDVKVIATEDHRRFSGTFHHFNLEDALKQICDPMDLKFDIQSGGRIVVEKQ